MKKTVILFSAALLVFSACKEGKENQSDAKQAIADSLYEEVMDGHDIGMAKTPRLSKMQAEAKRLLDSIAALPAKAQDMAAPYKARLDSLLKDLEYADFAMNKWMEEFKYDSAKNDLEQRIKYLTDEKMRVGKVKDAILNSLQRADSLIRQ